MTWKYTQLILEFKKVLENTIQSLIEIPKGFFGTPCTKNLVKKLFYKIKLSARSIVS